MASHELVAGRYRVEEELGRGASAIVYRAIDTRLERSVALKQMREAGWDERLQRSFLDEARVLASLHHPRLLEVYDAGIDERGVPYVASRLLVGETLEAALAPGALAPRAALNISLPVLGALAVAHDRGIIHRDVKPSNIFLERGPDGRSSPVLLDFGIARRSDAQDESVPGTALGTPAYMAPEIVAGAPPTPETDLWSMGVVLYRLLSGGHPFAAVGPLATLAAVARDTPRPLAESVADVPTPLALAVDRALRPQHLRYADAREFARALLDAAIASGIDLPTAPDPLGLPHWDAWVASAASSTARVTVARASASHSQVAAHDRCAPARRSRLPASDGGLADARSEESDESRERPPAPSGASRWTLGVAAAALVVACGALALASGEQAGRSRDAATNSPEVTAEPVAPIPEASLASSVMNEPPPSSDEDSDSPARQPERRPHPGPATRAAPRPAPTPVDAPEDDALPAIVTSWEL